MGMDGHGWGFTLSKGPHQSIRMLPSKVSITPSKGPYQPIRMLSSKE